MRIDESRISRARGFLRKYARDVSGKNLKAAEAHFNAAILRQAQSGSVANTVRADRTFAVGSSKRFIRGASRGKPRSNFAQHARHHSARVGEMNTRLAQAERRLKSRQHRTSLAIGSVGDIGARTTIRRLQVAGAGGVGAGLGVGEVINRKRRKQESIMTRDDLVDAIMATQVDEEKGPLATAAGRLKRAPGRADKLFNKTIGRVAKKIPQVKLARAVTKKVYGEGVSREDLIAAILERAPAVNLVRRAKPPAVAAKAELKRKELLKGLGIGAGGGAGIAGITSVIVGGKKNV
jgi:hypothetical protein